MLPEHVTRDLRYLEIYTARKMRNLRAGTFTSRSRGSGFDFDQHRPYRTGDDVRRIDWNVTARFRQPFVRETHAERELNVVVALDLSASMSFGTARLDKRELMLYIAACFAFSAAADQINLGLIAFGDRVLQYWPPRRSKGRAWRALDELWRLDAATGPTRLAPVAAFLQKRLRHESVVFVVSDFLADEAVPDSPEIRLLAATHDVVGVVVLDPSEVDLFDSSGEIRVRDPESGRRRRLVLTGRTRRRYRDAMARHRTRLTEAFFAAGMDHTFLMDRTPREGGDDSVASGGPPSRTTGGTATRPVPIVEPLMELFGARRRMR
jgi:uncharacterized protein (DUF58 family)